MQQHARMERQRMLPPNPRKMNGIVVEKKVDNSMYLCNCNSIHNPIESKHNPLTWKIQKNSIMTKKLSMSISLDLNETVQRSWPASSIRRAPTFWSGNPSLTTDGGFFCALAEKWPTSISSNYYQSNAIYWNKKEADFTLSCLSQRDHCFLNI